MCILIAEHSTFNTNSGFNRALVNVFTNQQVTSEQTHVLLNARKVGEQGSVIYITHQILQLSSVVNGPVRRKQLLTMAPPKRTKKHLSQQQKEQCDTIKCLWRRLAWCNQTRQQLDESKQQYSL